MPSGDGTGPIGGGGPGTGSGGGRGMGGGRGRNNGPSAAGPTGVCVCPQCGETITHRQGSPCMDIKCPKCGNPMTRG